MQAVCSFARVSSFALAAVFLSSCDPTGPDMDRPMWLTWVNARNQVSSGERLTLSLRVTNGSHVPVAGVTVLWETEAGSGIIEPTSARTARDGVAVTELLAGPGHNRVVARVQGHDLLTTLTVHGCVDCAEWNVLNPATDARAWATAVPFGNNVWVIGGEKASSSTDAIDVFEPARATWRRAAVLPLTLSASFAAAVQDRIYVIGGYRPEDSFWAGYPAVRALDPSTGEWTEKSPLAVGRYFAAGAVIDGRIYVVGGHALCDIEWCSRGPLASLEIYDPATDRWTNGPPMNYARAAAGAAALHGKLYVAGGTAGVLHWFDTPVSFVEMFDPQSSAWIQKAHLPVTGPVRLVAANDRLYAFGPGSLTHEYDPATDTWRRVRNTPSPLFGPAVAAIGDSVFVFGGYLDSEKWWSSPISDAVYVLHR